MASNSTVHFISPLVSSIELKTAVCLNSHFHIYGGDMHEIACFLDTVTLTYEKDDEATQHDSASTSVAVQPASTSSSSAYVISNIKWHNCRSDDPVQVTEFRQYITLDVAITESLVFNTAVDIRGGTIFDLITARSPCSAAATVRPSRTRARWG